MHVIRVIMQAKPDKQQDLIEIMAKDSEISQKFEGCLMFNLFQDVTNANSFILYEEWETAENFEAYQKSEYLDGQRELIFPLLDGAPDSAYYESKKVN